jgi:hypothetical protein
MLRAHHALAAEADRVAWVAYVKRYTGALQVGMRFALACFLC